MTYSYWDGARGLSVFYVHSHRTKRVERYIIGFICALFLLTTLSVASRVAGGVERLNLPVSVEKFLAATPLVAKAKPAATMPLVLDAASLQRTVTAWAASQLTPATVEVASIDGTALASSNAHQVLSMASVYKLFLAYAAYQDIDTGKHSLDEPYLNDWTRGKCLDEMIRSSNNPCGEKMLAEYTSSRLLPRFKAMGLTDTSFAQNSTSAHDVSILLSRLWAGQGLSPISHQRLLGNMRNQIYRSGLPAGFAGLDVYDKVGMQAGAENNDVGIVVLPDGQPLIVAVLSFQAAGNPAASLAKNLSHQLGLL